MNIREIEQNLADLRARSERSVQFSQESRQYLLNTVSELKSRLNQLEQDIANLFGEHASAIMDAIGGPNTKMHDTQSEEHNNVKTLKRS